MEGDGVEGPLNHDTNILGWIILCCVWRAGAVVFRMFSSIPGLSPLVVPSHLWQPQISPDIARWGDGQSLPPPPNTLPPPPWIENYCSRILAFWNWLLVILLLPNWFVCLAWAFKSVVFVLLGRSSLVLQVPELILDLMNQKRWK